jgi:hypothetical protein
MERDGPKALTAVLGPLGIIYYPNEKAKVMADCIGKPFHIS